MADYISYRLEWDQEPPTLNGVATILAQAHRGPERTERAFINSLERESLIHAGTKGCSPHGRSENLLHLTAITEER